VSKAVDPYLHAAEGFLHAVRDDIDKLDLRLDDSLKIATVYAQVSLARSLREIADVTLERMGGEPRESPFGENPIAGHPHIVSHR
jgi:hypothetical protein